MKRTRTGVIAIAALLLLGACSEQSANNSNSEQTEVEEGRIISEPVGPEVFNNHLNDEGAIILDVRTDAEVSSGMIPGARQLEYGTEEMKKKLMTMDKNATVLVYCAAGGRSGKVRQMMLDQGFQTVYDLTGGIAAWNAAGMELVQP